MENTRLCLAGITISVILLSSVVLNGGSTLAYELSPAASSTRRRDNGVQTVLDLLDFAQEEEERHLQEEYADQIHNHQREKRFPRIPMGEACKTRRDCSHTHCCAMKFGRPVCRMRPTLGQTCRPSAQSPRAYEMFTSCPCAAGLRCWKRKGKNIGVCV